MKQYYIIGNSQQWCFYSWKGELTRSSDIHFFKEDIPLNTSRLLKNICTKHFSRKLNIGKKKMPFKRIWYSLILKSLNLNYNDENIIVFYDWGRLASDLGFITYLKKNVPKIKCIYLLTNVVRISGAKYYYILDQLPFIYDGIFTFDRNDAKDYNFKYSPLIYTSCTEEEESSNSYDLFFIGNAKDRLRKILDIFEKAHQLGLSCDFNIVGVKDEDQKYKTLISYNKPLSYPEVLRKVSRCNCIVDIIQSQSTGLTMKVCESVIYGKKLITNNPNVKEEPFYKKNNVMILGEDKTDILSFMKTPFETYSKDDIMYFSPRRFFKDIDLINNK